MKLPVFPNWYPYNDMFFDGRLQIGDCAVKTRSYNWDYRGLVLFYTSGRTEKIAVRAYNYKNDPAQHGVIIGMADLVATRELTTEEAKKMVCNFNNLTPQVVNRILRSNGVTAEDLDAPFWIKEYGDYIAPFKFGYFFKNPKRFTEPVPFIWPSGPVRPIFREVTQNPELYWQILLAKSR